MPKIVDHEKYRRELLNKYFEHFARRGYADVTMREIAQALDVSTGTLYHYFPTKKSILEQLFKLASRYDASKVLSRISEDASLETRLTIFIDFVMENEGYFQDIVLLTIDYWRFHDSDQEAFKIMREADRYYTGAISNGLGLDERSGLLLTVFLNGLVYHRLAFPDSVSFKKLGEMFKQMMLVYFNESR